jgi:hypothetical protein
MEEWKKGNFTYYNPKEATATPTSLARPHLAEKDLFTEIGINEAFLKEITSRKQALLDRRAGFLQNLVLYQCFNSQNIRYECDMVREFLQDLLELKQIERLTKITRSFIPTNYSFTFGESLNIAEPGEGKPGAGELDTLLASLFSVVPSRRDRHSKNPQSDIGLPGFISPYSSIDYLFTSLPSRRNHSKRHRVPDSDLPSFISSYSGIGPLFAYIPKIKSRSKNRPKTPLPKLNLSSFISPYSGIKTLLSGRPVPVVSTARVLPDFNVYQFISPTGLPSISTRPVATQSRKKHDPLSSFDFSGLFSPTASTKTTTRKVRRRLKPGIIGTIMS